MNTQSISSQNKRKSREIVEPFVRRPNILKAKCQHCTESNFKLVYYGSVFGQVKIFLITELESLLRTLRAAEIVHNLKNNNYLRTNYLPHCLHLAK